MRNITLIRAVTVSESIEFFDVMIPDLEAKGFNVIALSSPGKELQELRDKGTKTIELPMERRVSLIRDFISLFRLIRVFKKEKPTIVHSMTPKAGLLCMLAAWICRVPKRVHTFTGLVWPTTTGVTRRILIATDWMTCFCATHIIPEGVGVMNDLRDYVTHKPMQVLGYGNVRGIDLKRFSRRPEVISLSKSLMNPDVFTFIFVGRIVRDKGINELMEAFVKLLSFNKGIRLFLVGNYEKKLDPLSVLTIDRINTISQIQAVGPKYGDELLAYYAASDCFVFPSYREGFPNTVMEAGAMGLPSIVTDINGSREIINNGKNGVIIPSKDAQALYAAMKNMIEAREEYKYMATNARPMIESRFEQGFVRSCLLDFYDEIMSN